MFCIFFVPIGTVSSLKVCARVSIDMASVQICAVIKVKPLRFNSPLGEMLKKVFRLNRNRCQSCQEDKLPMNPLGKGYQLQRQFERRLPWPE